MKHFGSTTKSLLVSWTISALIAAIGLGCGTNVFEATEAEDPAEDATLKLEDGDANGAISILEEALVNDPDNPQYTSILSLAYATRAGVEPLEFARRFPEANVSDDSGFNAMFALLPDPTTENLSDINTAVTLLTSIPSDQRLPGDLFKLAMFQTAAVVMTTKQFDADGDGGVDVTEVENITEAQAIAIFNQIRQSRSLLEASGAEDETTAEAAEKIAEVEAEIDAMPGDTDDEKLRNYLAAQAEAQAATDTQ